MQAVESQKLILYQTDLRGQWPEDAARAFARRLPYARRLASRPAHGNGRASLVGIALALRALARLLERRVRADEIAFADGDKPRLGGDDPRAAADFSISHSGPFVACAAAARGRVGLDVEMGADERIADWVLREAALKASGQGLRALREIRELQLSDGRFQWRGESWHVQRLEGFTGACACIVSSIEAQSVERHAIDLAGLFVS